MPFRVPADSNDLDAGLLQNTGLDDRSTVGKRSGGRGQVARDQQATRDPGFAGGTLQEAFKRCA